MDETEIRRVVAVERLVESLRNAGAWVKHWQEDVACNLKPTETSLAACRQEIEGALAHAKRAGL